MTRGASASASSRGGSGCSSRAVEERVENALPHHLDDITAPSRGRREFNRQVLATLESDHATGLGGEPLELETLTRLDRSFTFDNVARRITRQRLLDLLIELRHFVTEYGFDLAWARPGDPAEWLGESGLASRVGAEQLVDGWGRPFRLRPASRPRFTRIQPVDGYELVSAGPDGRYGNGDDVVDPTARVLASGGVYAEAVGEDLLVARLQSVELGRASLDSLRESLGLGDPYIAAPDESGGGRLARQRTNLPPIVRPDPNALALYRPDRAGASLVAELSAESGHARTTLAFGDEPLTWGVLAYVRDERGHHATVFDEVFAGASFLLDGDLPSRLRAGESLEVPVQLTNLRDEDASIRLSVETRGEAVGASLDGAITVPAGEAREVILRLSGQRDGGGRVIVRAARGDEVAQLRGGISVDRGRLPMRRYGTGFVRGRTYDLRIEIPESGRAPRGRVVLLDPSAMGNDPALDAVREDIPGILAWGATSAGRSLNPAQRAAVLSPPTRRSQAERAARRMALMSLVARDPDDQDAQAALRRAGSRWPNNVERPSGREPAIALARAFAILAAGGVPETPRDNIDRYLVAARAQLRRALFLFPEDPGVQARCAAALLLADPEDGYGLAMLDRALEAAPKAEDRRHIVYTGDAEAFDRTGHGPEATGAGLALALAAHLAGRAEAREELLRGAGMRITQVTRGNVDDVVYWMALASYGALGLGGPESVEVNVGQGWQTVDLAEGQAVVEAELEPGGTLRARVRSGARAAVFARVEVGYGDAFAARDDAPFTLTIQGDVGEVGGRAGLVLDVTAGEEAVATPIVEIQLPSGVDADDELAAALTSQDAVLEAEALHPGYMRLRLRGISAGQTLSVPLAFRWTSASPVRGLGIVGYESGARTALTVLPPTEMTPTRGR